MGICLVLNSILLTLEEYNVFETKRSYRFLFYFSYYSLTLYLSHYLLFFLFRNQLNVYSLCLFIVVTVILYGLVLKFFYDKLGNKISLKIQIGRLAVFLTKIKHKENKRIGTDTLD